LCCCTSFSARSFVSGVLAAESSVEFHETNCRRKSDGRIQLDKPTRLAKSVTTRDGKARLVVAAAVRDSYSHLVILEKRLDTLLRNFHVVRMVFFFENDSTDNTTDNLKSWKWPVKITSVTNLTGPYTFRLAKARNEIWRAIKDLPEAIDFVLMIDFDEVNYHIAHLE
jgi:hypothetical protein